MHTYCGNFEVHLTVGAAGALDAFRSWCEAERCKCVRIVLARGMHVEQPMATWRRGRRLARRPRRSDGAPPRPGAAPDSPCSA